MISLIKNINIKDKTKLQYFSKLYNEWINFKITDRLDSLLKYKYKIRVNPIYEIKDDLSNFN